jgi:hypothetical protein
LALDRQNYILSDDAKKTFVKLVSENTGNKNEALWWEAIRANKDCINKTGWACETFIGQGKHKAVIVMGASPAIKRQADRLRELAKDDNYILIGLSSGLKWLADENIKPTFCFVAETIPRVLDWFEGVPEDFMKGITLIADIHTNPKVLDIWKGEVQWLATFSAITKMDKKVKKWLFPVNGCNEYFPALGAQVCEAVAFANIVLCSPVVIFVGQEYSFPSDDCEKDKYYANRDDEKDHYHRAAHLDIYGNVVYTTFSLLQTKYIIEDWTGKIPCWFFNATEAGILGIAKDKNIPWIYQFTLDMALKQAQSVIYRGTPITTDLLIKPAEQKIFHYNGAGTPQLGGFNYGRL